MTSGDWNQIPKNVQEIMMNCEDVNYFKVTTMSIVINTPWEKVSLITWWVNLKIPHISGVDFSYLL